MVVTDAHRITGGQLFCELTSMGELARSHHEAGVVPIVSAHLHFIVTDANNPQASVCSERATDFLYNSTIPAVLLGNFGHTTKNARDQKMLAEALHAELRERGFDIQYTEALYDASKPSSRSKPYSKKIESIGLKCRKEKGYARHINPDNFLNALLNDVVKSLKWIEYPNLFPALKRIAQQHYPQPLIVPIFADDFRVISQAMREKDVLITSTSTLTLDRSNDLCVLHGLAEPPSVIKIIGKKRLSPGEKVNAVFDTLATEIFEHHYQSFSHDHDSLRYAEVKGVFYSLLAEISVEDKLRWLKLAAEYMAQPSIIEKQNFVTTHYPGAAFRFLGPTFKTALKNFLFMGGLFE